MVALGPVEFPWLAALGFIHDHNDAKLDDGMYIQGDLSVVNGGSMRRLGM